MTFPGSGRHGRFRLPGRVSMGRIFAGRAFVAVAAVSCLAGVVRAQTGSRPNIVLFYVDDLRHDGLGVTGHDFVQTPNLDQRVAGQGMNFRNSFVNCPLCSPSRASLMTGQYATTHGYTVNDDVNSVPDERLPIYQHALRAAGYRTALVGKWHMDSYLEARPGFDYWAAFQGQGVHVNPQLRVKKDAAPAITVNGTGFTTTVLTDYALDFLRDYGTGGSRAEPFALTLSFKAVHAPHGDQYTASGGSYAGQVIDRPPNATPAYGGYDINDEKPVFSRPGLGGLTLNNTMGNSVQISQMEMMKDIDANIGRVLDALEAKGLDDDTLVIFTSDNGFFWGEHGRGDKRLAYEESIRVPLLMKGPGVDPGRTSDALVTNIDVAPTILRAAGVAVPKSMQGQPLNGLLSGSGDLVRDAVYAEYYPEEKQPGIPRWEAVRSTTHLYIAYPDLGTQFDELYDVVHDAYQVNNLLQPGPAEQLPAETKDLQAQMQRRLLDLRKEANGVNPFTRKLVNGDALDFSVTESGVLRNDPSVGRVGSSTDAPNDGYGRSAVLAFELPAGGDPALLERAYVSFHIVAQTGNVSTVNADLWAIGITDGTTRLAEHLEANTEIARPDRADNLKLQDNIIALGKHVARTFSDDQGATLLAGYLRTFYEAHPDYAGGRFLQVRLNTDRDLGATSIGWDVSTMEAPTSETDPRPFTFRQPALSMQFTAIPTPAKLTWYGDGVHPGGDGTWTLTGNNWFDGTTVRSWVPGARAIFSGTGGTVTLDSGVAADGGLEFTSAGYTLTGAGLTLGGTAGGAVEVAGGATATVAATLTGTTGLVKAGAGTLALGAANTYTGATSVNRGTLLVTHSDALAASPILVQTGGTLALPTATRLVLSATSLTVDQATGGTVDIGKGRIDIATGATEADLRADLIAGRTAAGTFSGTSG
ncbi:MAG: sulfatase-like hydrolase/transferase, partial [Planctomycetaceae bacterium]